MALTACHTVLPVTVRHSSSNSSRGEIFGRREKVFPKFLIPFPRNSGIGGMQQQQQQQSGGLTPAATPPVNAWNAPTPSLALSGLSLGLGYPGVSGLGGLGWSGLGAGPLSPVGVSGLGLYNGVGYPAGGYPGGYPYGLPAAGYGLAQQQQQQQAGVPLGIGYAGSQQQQQQQAGGLGGQQQQQQQSGYTNFV